MTAPFEQDEATTVFVNTHAVFLYGNVREMNKHVVKLSNASVVLDCAESTEAETIASDIHGLSFVFCEELGCVDKHTQITLPFTTQTTLFITRQLTILLKGISNSDTDTNTNIFWLVRCKF